MWNDKSKLWWKQPTANGSRLDIIILCGFIACSCVIHFYPGVEGQSGERGQEVFQFYYVVESIWLFTTDSFRRVIMMLSGQGDPPIVSIKGIMWAHIGSLTQKARHARGENYFSFLCCCVSRALRCKLNCGSGQSTKGTLSTCHIYDRDLCWCAFELIHFFRCIYCHVDHS